MNHGLLLLDRLYILVDNGDELTLGPSLEGKKSRKSLTITRQHQAAQQAGAGGRRRTVHTRATMMVPVSPVLHRPQHQKQTRTFSPKYY